MALGETRGLYWACPLPEDTDRPETGHVPGVFRSFFYLLHWPGAWEELWAVVLAGCSHSFPHLGLADDDDTGKAEGQFD